MSNLANPWEETDTLSLTWDDDFQADETTATEPNFVRLEPNTIYGANIVGHSVKELPRDPAKPPVRIVDFHLKVWVENDEGELEPTEKTMRGRWLKGAFNGEPADFAEFFQVVHLALGDNAPRDPSGRPLLDGEHQIPWWIEQCMGRPIRVRTRPRSYVDKAGEQKTALDIFPHSAWPEGEVL